MGSCFKLLERLNQGRTRCLSERVGVLARSGDHSNVLAAANDSSAELAVFDSGGNVVAGPVTSGTGTIPWAAANNDTTRITITNPDGESVSLDDAITAN